MLIHLEVLFDGCSQAVHLSGQVPLQVQAYLHVSWSSGVEGGERTHLERFHVASAEGGF